MNMIDLAEKLAEKLAEAALEDPESLLEVTSTPQNMSKLFDCIELFFPLKATKILCKRVDSESVQEETLKEIEKKEKFSKFVLKLLELGE